jgi:hypothetical protein
MIPGLLAPLLLGWIPAHALASVRTRQVTSGIRLIRITEPGPVRAFALSVELRSHAVDVELGARHFPSYGAPLADIAERVDAVAAINGDMGVIRPAHPFARDGELVQTLLPNSNVFAVDGDGEQAFIGQPQVSVRARSGGPSISIARWNSGQPKSAEIAAFTAVGGLLEAPNPGTCWLRLRPAEEPGRSIDGSAVSRRYDVSEEGCDLADPARGEQVVLAAQAGGGGASWIAEAADRGRLSLRWATRWPGIVEIHGGFPLLVRHGRSAVDTPCRTEFCRRQPRTGVGVTAGCVDGVPATGCRVLLAVVDGRRVGWSRGATLPEFARLFVRLGAVAALNLDGGGSSSLLIRGRTINRPSDTDRKVQSALLVLAGPDPLESSAWTGSSRRLVPWYVRRPWWP